MSYKLVTLRIIILRKIAKGERHKDWHMFQAFWEKQMSKKKMLKRWSSQPEKKTSIRSKLIELIHRGNCEECHLRKKRNTKTILMMLFAVAKQNSEWLKRQWVAFAVVVYPLFGRHLLRCPDQGNFYVVSCPQSSKSKTSLLAYFAYKSKVY